MDYELTIVLAGNSTPAKKKSVLGMLEKQIKVFKGTIKKTDDWGKLDLAYKIKKNTAGVFLYFELELVPEAARDLKNKLRLESDIIRLLLVKKD